MKQTKIIAEIGVNHNGRISIAKKLIDKAKICGADYVKFQIYKTEEMALKELTKFPIISDPSHASFWAPWVSPLAYASIAAGCDGLIIEMHPNPSKSAVDPLQPLNFKEFLN